MVIKTSLTLVIIIATSLLMAQTDPFRRKHFNVENYIAIEGYDPISYFDGKPQEGEEDIRFSYIGITYLFATTTNMARFIKAPEKYEPAYGGWCAYAMGKSGEKVKVDPETFKVLDGRLYLFYNFWGNDTLDDWNKNEYKLKDAGDRNWEKLVR
jgi:YHS domain-containing protein